MQTDSGFGVRNDALLMRYWKLRRCQHAQRGMLSDKPQYPIQNHPERQHQQHTTHSVCVCVHARGASVHYTDYGYVQYDQTW